MHIDDNAAILQSEIIKSIDVLKKIENYLFKRSYKKKIENCHIRL